MAGNRKQAGANLTNAEYSTGRCSMQCEQCFVNLGQVGSATIGGMLNPALAEDNTSWIAYAKKLGWRNHEEGHTFRLLPGDSGYKKLGTTPIPAFDQRAAYDIPKMPDSGVTSRKRPMKLPELRATIPYFMRVSSMSDSSLAPISWCERVLKTWGDYCFFNTSVMAALAHPEHFERCYHKVVVTTNGGHQEPPPIPQIGKRSKVDPKRDILGSMGDRAPGDFLSPVTLASEAGPLAMYEGQVKFYRLRALPTIAARLETDVPIVVTQMRFRGLAHVLEFARKYGLSVEVRHAGVKSIVKLCALFRDHLRRLQVSTLNPRKPGKSVLTQIDLWYEGRDNGSPFAGAKTTLRFESAYFKAAGEDFAHYEYVCDRAHMQCAGCGLCASLDGTQTGGVNALNVITVKADARGKRSDLIVTPETAKTHYLYDYQPLDQPNYYAALIEEAFDWVRNPEDEVDLDHVATLAREVRGYALQGQTPDSNVCESWNTHEDVLSLAGYCVFSVLREGKRQGLSKTQALDAMQAFLLEACDGVDITVGLDDLDEIWEGTSTWNEMFGML